MVLVAAGDGQTLVATRGGDVYGWGCYKDKEGKQWFDAVDPKKAKRKQDEPLNLTALFAGAGASRGVALADVIELKCGSRPSTPRAAATVTSEWLRHPILICDATSAGAARRSTPRAAATGACSRGGSERSASSGATRAR